MSAPELRAQRLEAEARIQRIESQRAEAEAKLAALQASMASSQSTYDRLKAASATPGVISGNDLEVALRSLEVQRLNADAQRSSVETLLKEKAVAEAAFHSHVPPFVAAVSSLRQFRSRKQKRTR